MKTIAADKHRPIPTAILLAVYFTVSAVSGRYALNYAALLGLGAACAVLLRLSQRPGADGRSFPAAFAPSAETLMNAVVPAALLILAASLSLESLRLVMVDYRDALAAPFARTFIEGREVTKAWLLLHGRTIYPDFTDYPYIATLYGPVYHAAAALMNAAADTPLQAAVLVSAAATAVLTLVVWALALTFTGRPLLSLIVALAVFTAPYLEYGHHTRPDMTAWCLAFAALLCFVWADKIAKPGRPGRGAGVLIAASALLTVAAYLTKQQSLPFFGAICLFSLLHKKYGLFVRYAVTVAALAAICWPALQFLLPGDFSLHTLYYPGLIAKDPSITSWRHSLARFARLFMDFPGLIVLYLCWFGYSLRRTGLRLDIINTLFLVHLPFLYVLMSTWGAEINYFISFLVTMYLGAAAALARLAGSGKYGPLLAAACLSLLVPIKFDASFLDKQPKDFAEQRARAETLAELIADAPGGVIIDAEGAYPFLQDPRTFSKLKLYDGTETFSCVKLGLWDPEKTSFGRDIKNRVPTWFIDSRVFISPRILSLLSYYYKKDRTIGKYTLYSPRPEDAVLTLADSSVKRAAAAGLTATLEDAANLKVWGDYVQPLPDSPEGSLTYKLAADRPMKTLGLVCFPRLHGPGQAFRVLASADGEPFAEIARFDDAANDPGSGWDNRLEVAIDVDAKTIRIKFELLRGAQFWFNAEHPLGFFATFL